MRETLRSHPGPVSVVGGAIAALVLFFVGGSGDLEAVNAGLAALLGFVFGGAMYVMARALRPPPRG
jgi:hypothetical protein